MAMPRGGGRPPMFDDVEEGLGPSTHPRYGVFGLGDAVPKDRRRRSRRDGRRTHLASDPTRWSQWVRAVARFEGCAPAWVVDATRAAIMIDPGTDRLRSLDDASSRLRRLPDGRPREASRQAFARVLALTDPTDRLRRPPGLARSRAEPNRCDRPAEAGRRADRSSVAA